MDIITNDHYVSKDNYDHLFLLFLSFFLVSFGEANLPFEFTLTSSFSLLPLWQMNRTCIAESSLTLTSETPKGLTKVQTMSFKILYSTLDFR